MLSPVTCVTRRGLLTSLTACVGVRPNAMTAYAAVQVPARWAPARQWMKTFSPPPGWPSTPVRGTAQSRARRGCHGAWRQRRARRSESGTTLGHQIGRAREGPRCCVCNSQRGQSGAASGTRCHWRACSHLGRYAPPRRPRPCIRRSGPLYCGTHGKTHSGRARRSNGPRHEAGSRHALLES